MLALKCLHSNFFLLLRVWLFISWWHTFMTHPILYHQYSGINAEFSWCFSSYNKWIGIILIPIEIAISKEAREDPARKTSSHWTDPRKNRHARHSSFPLLVLKSLSLCDLLDWSSEILDFAIISFILLCSLLSGASARHHSLYQITFSSRCSTSSAAV